MLYPDLANECGVDRGPHIRAIGWLSNEQPFSTGTVSMEFLATLRVHLQSPVQPILSPGIHRCELCPTAQAESNGVFGYRNLWIPTAKCVYVAPEMVIHYIEAHSYRPPAEFVAAVLACPDQGSAAYLALFNRFPRWLGFPVHP